MTNFAEKLSHLTFIETSEDTKYKSFHKSAIKSLLYFPIHSLVQIYCMNKINKPNSVKSNSTHKEEDRILQTMEYQRKLKSGG